MTDSETLAMWLRRCALVRAKQRGQRVQAMRAERSSDGHHDSAVADVAPQPDPDPIVAKSDFKAKLKTINFGRVPGGTRNN